MWLHFSHIIRSFRHKGLRLLFVDGDRGKLRADQADKAERVLQRLAAAERPSHMACLVIACIP